MITLSCISKTFVIPPSRSSLTLFKAISKRLRNRPERKIICALDSVDLCIKTGETVGIIGPNGSGKSTLMRIIAGIYKPTSGVSQIERAASSPLQTKIVLFRDFSVKENVLLFGAMMGLSRKEIHESYDGIIDCAGLSEFANAEVRVLSEGMRDRLAFAISIATAKDILLLDEVVSAGDSTFREKYITIITKLKKEQKTILLASHDLEMINELCDTTLLLNKGRAVAFGKTKEVINRYRTLSEA